MSALFILNTSGFLNAATDQQEADYRFYLSINALEVLPGKFLITHCCDPL